MKKKKKTGWTILLLTVNKIVCLLMEILILLVRCKEDFVPTTPFKVLRSSSQIISIAASQQYH